MDAEVTLGRRLLQAAALASMLVTTRGFAQTPGQVDDARKHYEAGLQLTREESYEAALAEFERAYQIAPSYRILYNIGSLRRQLNDFAGAKRALDQYLADGATSIEPKRVDEVKADLQAIAARIGHVRIEVDVDGVEIRVDGAVVGRSPLAEAVALNPGQRKIEGVKTEWLPASAVVLVTGGETTAVKLPMTMLSAQSAPPPPPPTPARPPVPDEPALPPSRFKTPALVGWGVTAGLVAGSAIAGVAALSASSSLKDDRALRSPTRAALDSDVDRTRSLALVSDVFTVGAVLAAGASAYFTWRWLGSSPRPVAVGLGPGSASLVKAW